MARQHAEVPLEAADLPLVAAGSGESQPAGVPRLGARPLALGERRVTQALARRDRARLIELGFRDRQRPLEVAGPLRVLTRPQKQLPERAERLHLGATVLQRLGDAQRNVVPGPCLTEPADALFAVAGAQQRRDRLRDPHRGQRGRHRPYSFIFRVNVLRWIPRISAAAPIWPLVWVSTRVIWRASTSARVSSAPSGRSGSVASSPRNSSGRCSARSTSSVATITARSMTLRSSRTFPTHAWLRSSSSA